MGHRGQQILDDVVESRLVDLCQFRRRAADGDVALIGGRQAHPFAQLSLNGDLPYKGFRIHAVRTREPHDQVAKTDFDLGLDQFEDGGYSTAAKRSISYRETVPVTTTSTPIRRASSMDSVGVRAPFLRIPE